VRTSTVVILAHAMPSGEGIHTLNKAAYGE
jgi:hypothetical protein